MDDAARERWLTAFVTDLEVGGERVPLDRVIKNRIQGFVALREQGLTWPAITALLSRAGARRADGLQISADQLRTDVSRILRRRATTRLLPTQPTTADKPGQLPYQAASKSSAPSGAPAASLPPVPSAVDKELTANELTAALARIRK